MKAQIRIKSLQDEEYANPASVKSNQGEQEMQEGETIEEFEDRVLNKRAAHLNTILKYDCKLYSNPKAST